MMDPDRVGRSLVVGAMAITGLAILVALLVDLGRGPTSTGTLITGLHRDLLLVAVPIAVLVEGALVYAVWRFRDNDDPKPTPDDRRLELAWTLATALVLVFVGVSAYQVMAQPTVTASAGPGAAPADVRVDVTGHQWYWSVEYPRENVTIRQADRIVLPTNRSVRITVRSGDVIHSFHAPALGLKADAVPGRTNVLSTRITRTGEYRLYCAEYCGAGHSRMLATIDAVPDPDYRAWLAAARNRSG